MALETSLLANPVYVSWFEELRITDIDKVGGKNASLGELIRTLKDQGVRVPDGFAITVDAYWTFLKAEGLKDKLRSHLDDLAQGKQSLAQVGRAIRWLFLQTPCSP
ncbi:PEP/pyruvate-binding domain-containing protein [Kovacikia minuta]|uniref:PEP/pyruvate-binding domain-containing protein n=1 Tax=Kovacikia minuta TaxID=2931930 RepID=UPI0036F413C4